MKSKHIGNIVYYNLDDLAEHFEVTKLTFMRYLRSGKLKGEKIGHRWLVTEDSLKAFLEGEGSKQGKFQQEDSGEDSD
ncbi:helix-turn-helix domain-containing protein [bacterium]|nr:helix-turn-helix domain-containing protein [bacterium]